MVVPYKSAKVVQGGCSLFVKWQEKPENYPGRCLRFHPTISSTGETRLMAIKVNYVHISDAVQSVLPLVLMFENVVRRLKQSLIYIY